MILSKDRTMYFTVFIVFLLFVPTLNIGLYARVSLKMSKIWRKIERSIERNKTHSPEYIEKRQAQVFNAFLEASKMIETTYDMTGAVDAIEEIEYFLPKTMPKMNTLEDIRRYKLSIMSHYKTLKEYLKYLDTLKISTLLNFSESIVSRNPLSVREYVQNVYYSLFGAEEDEEKAAEIFKQLAKNFETSNEQSCRKQQSAQQYLYSFYKDIEAIELRGIILMEFSWMILRIYGKGDFNAEDTIAKRQYQETMKRTVRILRNSLADASRTIWRCDPDKHIEGVTYGALTRLGNFRVNSNESSAGNASCGKPKMSTCHGTLAECRKSRREKLITDSNSLKRSWGDSKCTSCSCTCYGSKNSHDGDRAFSLHSSVADMKKNMVITGLRFQKCDGVFYLQIQQGKLLPRGAIDSSTLEWRPFKVLNLRVAEETVDYHEIKEKATAFALDELAAELPNFIVTAVRLQSTKKCLYLEVGFNEFDFESGKLILPDEISMWRNSLVCNRRHFLRTNAYYDDPITSNSKSFPRSTRNEDVEFQLTRQSKVNSQVIIPYLDLQDVVSNSPVPLEGASIYFKNVNGYGGFLAPRVETINLNNYPLTDLTKKNNEKIVVE